jgi:hypothetical protein
LILRQNRSVAVFPVLTLIAVLILCEGGICRTGKVWVGLRVVCGEMGKVRVEHGCWGDSDSFALTAVLVLILVLVLIIVLTAVLARPCILEKT